MEYRHGTCSSCGAHYRVPATFKADKAKCKKCEGVVELGPVESPAKEDAPTAGPARKPAPKPAARKPAPSSPKPAAPRPAAKAAPKSGTPRAGAREKDSVRAAAEAAADRVRNTGVRSGAPKKAEAGAAKAGSGRSSSRGRRKPAPKKKGNPAVLIGGVVVVILIALGGFFLVKGGEGSEAKAAETDTASVDAPANEAATEDPVEGAEEAPAEEAAAEEEPEEAPEEEKKPARDPKDPDSIDLTTLPDFEQLPETSDDEWQQLVQLAANFTDPEAGAAGNRARVKLLEAGRTAFPALINRFRTLNFASDEGLNTGDLVQRLLMDICRGQNFDWRYTTEPGDVYFNKRVVELWHGAWQQVVDNPKAWVKLGKLNEKEAAEYMAVHERVEDIGVDDDLDDF